MDFTKVLNARISAFILNLIVINKKLMNNSCQFLSFENECHILILYYILLLKHE